MTVIKLKNVHVFDSEDIKPISDIRFTASPGNILSGEAEEETDIVIDGEGCTLLPALIDCNINVAADDYALETFASFGIGTVLDMSSTSEENHAMRLQSGDEIGLPSYLAAGTVVAAANSEMMRWFPLRETDHIRTAAAADAFVAARVGGRGRADFIKVVADQPGIDDTVLAAIADAAHRQGLLAVAHASQADAYKRVSQMNYDIVTHMPLDGGVKPEVAQALAARDAACIPTLGMMRQVLAKQQEQGLSAVNAPEHVPVDYGHIQRSVKTLHDTGVRICAGTEANLISDAPVSLGDSLYREMELLVEAGLSNIEALRSATCIPATVFGLHDRGIVQAGRRADLILVEGNPLEDIRAIRNIKKAWIGGVEVENLRAG